MYNLTSKCSGFFCTAASNNKTALGRSPLSNFFNPSSKGSSWSANGFSLVNV